MKALMVLVFMVVMARSETPLDTLSQFIHIREPDSTWWRHERTKPDTSTMTSWTDYENGEYVCLAALKNGHLLDSDSLIPRATVEKILSITVREMDFESQQRWIRDSLYYEWQWANRHHGKSIGRCK